MSSETVQSATALELGAAILQQIPRDMPQEVALKWIQNKKALGKGLREVLMPPDEVSVTVLTPDPVVTKYNHPVDYDRSIEEVRKAGNYDWENNDITSENFPTSRKGIVDVEINVVHFDREFSSSEEAIAELDKLGLRPAETHELLTLGEVKPELQRGSPIIALGSVWLDRGGNRLVPCLRRYGSLRCLGLGWFDGGWGAGWRFAAVPK